MGRVSLTEAYDDRSVISKLNEMDKRVTENTTVVTSAEASAKASAQAAQETADRFAGSVGAVVQNANAQINASKAQVDQAKAEVDETVTTVAQAVQTANDASASAQQSATTVATYDTRLTAVENADTHNVKLEGNQNITGIKTVPTEATGSRSQQIANSAKVGAELDNYVHMMRTTGNQEPIEGKKTFAQPTGWIFGSNSSSVAVGTVYTIASIPRTKLSGTRGHLGIWLKSRSRADSLILSIYHHNGGALDLEIVVPHQGETTKTWTLSQDDNNIYLSFNGDGNVGADGWFAQGVFSVATNLTAVNVSSTNETIPGTIIKSVTL